MGFHRWAGAALVAAGSLWISGTAGAEPVSLGGRTAATVNASILNDDIQDTTITASASVSRVTPSGRFEFGASFVYIGFQIGADDVDPTSIFVPSGTLRVNTNPMGPEENIVAYLGGQIGVAILESEFLDEARVAGGPRAGIEFYITPDVALQAEYLALLQEDPIDPDEVLVTNTILLGLRVLF